MTDVIVLLVVAGVLLLHWLLSASRVRAVGLIVPALWAAVLVTLAVSGRMDSWRDWVFAVIGTLGLLGIWDRRRPRQSGSPAVPGDHSPGKPS